jgi:hypothetical protein
MTDQAELLIDDRSPAPRLSWRFLVILLTAVATATGSYMLMGARVTELAEQVRQVDDRGSKGLRIHLDATRDEMQELRVQAAETRKDIQFMREMLEYRLSTIEGRLAIRTVPRFTSAAPAPARRYDSAEQK